ncbi:MAG: patatin-like phospholipase family protein [Thermoflexibacter sp.]|jgi:patatin-like phospholipase/acyl hydrolase|nr:patatin-like phospholipase family protein [Thermoflexibacter sp.]
MSEIKPFKILSIDGGGIKGLYSAIILQHLEEEFCIKQGKTISDYFDMICGTSTGGLIALALSIKTPASQIANFYKKRGSSIFPDNSFIHKIWRGFKQKAWRGKYENKVLRNELEAILGDKTMSDAHNLLCIPSFNLTKSSPTVWKFPHKEGKYTRDGKVKMLDVALSTSAAPTYFPIHEIHPHGRFIDGGVWANNPTLCGVQEAIEFYINQPLHTGEIHFNTLKVLSISSVNKPSAESFRGSLNKSFLGWKDKLFNPFFEGQSFFTDRFMTNAIPKIYPNSTYHRITSPNLSNQQSNDIDLDKANEKSIKLLETLGSQVGYDYHSAKRNIIEPFFQHLKTYKTI